MLQLNEIMLEKETMEEEDGMSCCALKEKSLCSMDVQPEEKISNMERRRTGSFFFKTRRSDPEK